MTDIGKLLMGIGLFLLIAGAAVWGFSRLGFRGLPGDIRYQGRNVQFYFPVVTCVLLSVLMTAVLWFFQWLNRK